MRIAAIDIGTNSVLLLVVDVEAGDLGAVADIATVTRLGRGVDLERRLSVAGVERTLQCLEGYAAQCRKLGVARMAAVATSATRDASDGEQFLDAAHTVLGVRPAVIAGAEEASLTFEGALAGLPLPDERVCVFDVGGGSTEVVVGARASGRWQVEESASVDIGAVRLAERHLHGDPPTDAELAAARADARRALEASPPIAGRRLVGVAGTVTTLSAVVHGIEPYDGARVHGSTLTSDDLDRTARALAAMPLGARRQVPGLHPDRADVIVAGTLVVQEVARRAQAGQLLVSDRGVRWGLAGRLAVD